MRESAAMRAVARHEYGRMVKRKSFLLMTFGLPLFYLLLFALIAFFTMRSSGIPLGYVDQAGIFPTPPRRPEAYENIPTPVAYPDPESGQAAVKAGEIAALYILPPDYLQGGEVLLYVGPNTPSDMEKEFFADFIRANLIAGVKDEQVRRRLLEGPHYVTRTIETGQMRGGLYTVRLIIGIGAVAVLYLLMLLSGGYLLQAVADEKENRTLEILITSISPRALILGKIVGLMGVAITQLLIWGSAGLLGLIYYLTRPGTHFTFDLSLIPWGELALTLLFFIPSYLLLAAMMVALGVMGEDRRQAQQYSSLFTMPFFAPLFFIAQIIAAPNGALAVGMSFFPTTSFLVLMVRRAMIAVPGWQIALAWVILALTTWLALLAAARLFRLWMLRYGTSFSLSSLLRGGRHA